MDMEGNNENIRFECAFSEKAIRNNNLTLKIYVLVMSFILFFIAYMNGFTKLNLWLTFFYIIFIVFMSLFGMMNVKRLASESYLEITSDGQLKCKFKGIKEICYPVNEIKTIEESSYKEAIKRHATFPATLNTRGNDLNPTEGVLITFNRAWIKSIFPVFFNPADISGFISAIRQRIENQ